MRLFANIILTSYGSPWAVLIWWLSVATNKQSKRYHTTKELNEMKPDYKRTDEETIVLKTMGLDYFGTGACGCGNCEDHS